MENTNLCSWRLGTWFLNRPITFHEEWKLAAESHFNTITICTVEEWTYERRCLPQQEKGIQSYLNSAQILHIYISLLLRMRYLILIFCLCSIKDWKPGAAPTAHSTKPAPSSDAASLDQQITKQGDLVRSLKSSKAEKAIVNEAVKTLLDLKAKYKAATGQVSYLNAGVCNESAVLNILQSGLLF